MIIKIIRFNMLSVITIFQGIKHDRRAMMIHGKLARISLRSAIWNCKENPMQVFIFLSQIVDRLNRNSWRCCFPPVKFLV